MACRQPFQRPWSPRQLVVRDILDRSPSMQVLPPPILAHAHLRKKRSMGWQTIESECSTQLYCTSSSRRQSSSLLCLALAILHVVIVVVDDVDGEAKGQIERVTRADAAREIKAHPKRRVPTPSTTPPIGISSASHSSATLALLLRVVPTAFVVERQGHYARQPEAFQEKSGNRAIVEDFRQKWKKGHDGASFGGGSCAFLAAVTLPLDVQGKACAKGPVDRCNAQAS